MTKGIPIDETVAVKPKAHSLVILNNKEIKRAKNVNKSVVGNIRHKEYAYSLLGNKKIRQNMERKSKLHQIGTYDTNKISLSCFDDKRYILHDGVESLAYFHKDVVVYFSDNLS